MRKLFLALALSLLVMAAAAQYLPAKDAWQAGQALSLAAAERLTEEGRAFVAVEIPAEVKARMEGKSLPKGETRIGFADLRYLRLLHYTLDGKVMTGEMVVNKSIAQDVVEIFQELYKQRYPIERMRLIDDYDASDAVSMRHNNTSGFCFRAVEGAKKLSKHATGMAVDVNPLYNPYFRFAPKGTVSKTKSPATGPCGSRVPVGEKVEGMDVLWGTVLPVEGMRYVNRAKAFPYKIVSSSLVVRLFKQKGFRWGGDWRSCKDYQHFER